MNVMKYSRCCFQHLE